MKGWYIILVLLLWLTICSNGTIHREADLIHYAAKFSVEVYEIMRVSIIRIYDMNNYIITNMENFHMQKCLKANAYKDIWAFYDDVVMIILMKSKHNCKWTKKVYVYKVPSLGRSYLGPSLWRHSKDKLWAPSLGGNYTIGHSLWRQLKLLGPSMLEVVS